MQKSQTYITPALLFFTVNVSVVICTSVTLDSIEDDDDNIGWI